MTPPDDEYVRTIAKTVTGLMIAIESGAAGMEVVGHICLLVNTMIEHRDGRPRVRDQALVQAISRLP
jgi:hypothetical protein